MSFQARSKLWAKRSDRCKLPFERRKASRSSHEIERSYAAASAFNSRKSSSGMTIVVRTMGPSNSMMCSYYPAGGGGSSEIPRQSSTFSRAQPGGFRVEEGRVAYRV